MTPLRGGGEDQIVTGKKANLVVSRVSDGYPSR